MKLIKSWFWKLYLWWWGIHNRDLGLSILKYLSERPEEIGYPISLRDFLKLVGAKPWHAVYILDGLEKEGYVEYNKGAGVDYHRVSTKEMAEGNNDLVPMEYHHMAFSLTRKGFLHYADLRNGASVVRLQKWQIATFWVLAFATLIQAFAALKALDLFPWSTGEEQTESTPNEPAGREADKSTDDDSATTHPTQAGQMLPQGTLVLCGHCDTLGPQTKVPLKHPEE